MRSEHLDRALEVSSFDVLHDGAVLVVQVVPAVRARNLETESADPVELEPAAPRHGPRAAVAGEVEDLVVEGLVGEEDPLLVALRDGALLLGESQPDPREVALLSRARIAEGEDLDALIDVNIKTAFYINRAAVRSMRSEHIAGSIVTISSQMGLVGARERTVYAATKHALEGMTKALAWEVGRDGIRVSTVSPTFIDTELARPILAREGFRTWAESRIALGRIGRLDEVMRPVVFFASNASSLVMGTALVVDGGGTAV